VQGEAGEGEPLTKEEIEDLKTRCRSYCDDPDPMCVLDIGRYVLCLWFVIYIIIKEIALQGKLTLTKLKDAFAVMKNLVLEARRQSGSNPNDNRGVPNPPLISSHVSDSDCSVKELRLEIDQLKSNLQQREQEIAILVNMVKQGVRVEGAKEKSRMTDTQDKPVIVSNPSITGNTTTVSGRGVGVKSLQQQQKDRELAREELVIKRHLFGVPPPHDKAIFDDAKGSSLKLVFDHARHICPVTTSHDAIELDPIRHALNDVLS